ncbi:MAG TPA: GFA family protein [Gammaproteobacteria bacterium]|jgi:hypothetical protein
MKYAGGCHCGKIAYEVEGEPKEATECNCSICRRRGHLLWFLPGEKLSLKTPESDMSYYSFNKHHIKHYFCPNCGCAPFGMGAGKDGKSMVAVNLRCLPDVDLAGIKINHFDGKSL